MLRVHLTLSETESAVILLSRFRRAAVIGGLRCVSDGRSGEACPHRYDEVDAMLDEDAAAAEPFWSLPNKSALCIPFLPVPSRV